MVADAKVKLETASSISPRTRGSINRAHPGGVSKGTGPNHVSLTVLADHVQVFRSLGIDEVLAELRNRSWFVYPPGLARSQQWELPGVVLPEFADRAAKSFADSGHVLPIWQSADAVGFDVLGRSQLKPSAQQPWPGAKVITTLAGLCAVLRQIEGGVVPSECRQAPDQGAGDTEQQEGKDEEFVRDAEQSTGPRTAKEPFPLGKPALLSSIPHNKPMFHQSSRPNRTDRVWGLPKANVKQLQQTPPTPLTDSQSTRSGSQAGSQSCSEGNDQQLRVGDVFHNPRNINIQRTNSSLSQPASSRQLQPSASRQQGPHRPSAQQASRSTAAGASSKAPCLAGGPKDRLHRVLRLGWRPLVDVVCNSLTGRFLGGHDKDLYIQCTGQEFANAPLIDVKDGGCIMTCAQFEKKAGRELSKKWKESIHVVGDTDTGRATLITWLRRQASRKFGEDVIGQTCWIRWCSDGEFYKATINGFNMDTGKHKVCYCESLYVEELHLPVELLFFGEEKPPVQEHTINDMLEHPQVKGSPDTRSRADEVNSQSQKRGMGRRRGRAGAADETGPSDSISGEPSSPSAKLQRIAVDCAAADKGQQQGASGEAEDLPGPTLRQRLRRAQLEGAADLQSQQQQLAAAAAGLQALSAGAGLSPASIVMQGSQQAQMAAAAASANVPKLVQLPNGMTGLAVTVRDLLSMMDPNNPNQGPIMLPNGGMLSPGDLASLQAQMVAQGGLGLPGLVMGQGQMAGQALQGLAQGQLGRGQIAMMPGNGLVVPSGAVQMLEQAELAQKQQQPEMQQDTNSARRLNIADAPPGGINGQPIGLSCQLPLPPSQLLEETDLNVMFRWLLGLATALEPILIQQQQRLNNPLLPLPFSVATRFQTMLVYARSSEELRGFYEMFVARWIHHQNSRLEQASSMVEAILSSVLQSTYLVPKGPNPEHHMRVDL